MIYQEDLKQIAFAVSNCTGIGMQFIYMEEGQTGARKREYKEARMLCMYFAKMRTSYSLKAIGEHFGNRHHSTVIHAVSEIDEKSKIYDDVKLKFLRIEMELDRVIEPMDNDNLDVLEAVKNQL